ncbi:MAG: hypothetical protein GXP19_04980 [Gammaproteobacteria bacterium]|nr:hypothetical protein [Gammaproteobacteria bacterium]
MFVANTSLINHLQPNAVSTVAFGENITDSKPKLFSFSSYTRGVWDLGVNVRPIYFMARRNDE